MLQELHKMRVLYSARNLIKSIFSAQINKLLSPSGLNHSVLTTARNKWLPSAANVLCQCSVSIAVIMHAHDSKK